MSSSQSKREKFFLFRWINMISEVSGYLSGVAIVIATLIICQAVALRYLFGMSGVWTTEFAVYMLIFATFVGGAYGLKHDAHVGVDLITNQLPARAQAAVKLIASLLALVLVLVVDWRAWVLWWEATEAGWHSESAWGPPLTYPYFILPLGFSLIALQYLVIVSGNVQQLIKGDGEDDDTQADTERTPDQVTAAD
jgi:TRAP-type C4-dicarboxylate transport system permease small subunit